MYEVFKLTDGIPVYQTKSRRLARCVAYCLGKGYDYALQGEGW